MNEHDRLRWARALVFSGWMFVIAYVAYLVTQIRSAAAVKQASFSDGLWGQRIELISHATLPQNVIVLIPAVAAVVAGTWLVRPLVDRVVVQLRALGRFVAGLALVIIALAITGIVAVLFRNFDSVGDVQAILGRIGGFAMALAIFRVGTEAENS